MRFYTIVALLGVCTANVVSALNVTETHHWGLFQKFVHRFDKSYTNLVEFEKRFDIFRDNLHYIREQNDMNHKFELGITPFADLTQEEFSSFNGIKKGGPFSSPCNKFSSSSSTVSLHSYDWRDHNAVTPVKIKDNVDHVGHLAQLDLWKEHGLLQREN